MDQQTNTRTRDTDDTDFLPSGRRLPAGFSLKRVRSRLFAAQARELELMDRRQRAKARGEKFGPRLEQSLERVREGIDEIRGEMLSLDEEARRSV
jgi:hypothetical protein